MQLNNSFDAAIDSIRRHSCVRNRFRNDPMASALIFPPPRIDSRSYPSSPTWAPVPLQSLWDRRLWNHLLASGYIFAGCSDCIKPKDHFKIPAQFEHVQSLFESKHADASLKPAPSIQGSAFVVHTKVKRLLQNFGCFLSLYEDTYSN